jgi:SHS family lactate transporter-like MFS transporter
MTSPPHSLKHRLNRKQGLVFSACFLGWTLDAFDFFVLTFCLPSVALAFHVSPVTVTKSLFWTLCMRPVGALLFGAMAERYGRKPVLIANLICFTVFEVASGFAPTFGIFLLTRALFGVAMGGEWGVGAALALESLPAAGRGFFSGLLQEGYVAGSLLAAAMYGLVFPHLHGTGYVANWRLMFCLGAAPTLVVVAMLLAVDESPVWLAGRAQRAAGQSIGALLREVGRHWKLFAMLTALMTCFAAFSHGTQDLYPTFLKRAFGMQPQTVAWVAIAGNIGAFCGGITFGSLSEKLGRRRMMAAAALLAIPVIPLWVFSHTAALLACGGFVMQFMVQGAWGIVPVHLNEMSPGAVRAIFPGVTYQLGNLISSWNSHMQESAAVTYFGGRLAPALGWTVAIVGVCLAALAMANREAKGTTLKSR